MGLEVDSGDTSCDDLSESKSGIKEKWHTCPYKGCTASFRRPWRLDAHLCCHTGERPYECKKDGCQRAYTNLSHLRRHMSVSHEKKAYRVTQKCPYEGCMKEYSSVYNMHKHYKRAHETKLPYICDVCNKGFLKHNQLRTHTYQHTGVPEFTCDVCSVKFVTQHLLKRHMRGHSRKYICNIPECGVEFKTWTLLRKHYLLEHPNKMNCATCNKEFRTKGALNYHLLVHQNKDKRLVYPCPYEACPRFYLAEKNLKHHVQSSHEGKKHKCNFPGCDRELSTKQKLQLHLNLHTTGHLKTVSLQQRKTRKKRKDKGIGKRSMAVKLSGISVPYEVEKLILNAQDPIDIESLVHGPTETDQSESEHAEQDEAANKSEMCACSSETDSSELEKEENETGEESVCVPELSAQALLCNEGNVVAECSTSAGNVCSVRVDEVLEDNASDTAKLQMDATETEHPEVLSPHRMVDGVSIAVHRWLLLMMKAMGEVFPNMNRRTD